MKTKLLISGVGGSLFPYLMDKLRAKYDLYLIDSNPLVKEMYKNEKIFIVPLVTDDSYEKEIIKIIQKYDINYYIPLIDEEIIKAINISKKIGIKTLTPNKNFVELTLNKYMLMKELRAQNISDISTIMADKYTDNSISYPIFLKPNVGRGSRGIKKIDNKQEFEAYFILEDYKKEEVLVQPFIDGDEYTVSVTVNNLNKIMAIVPKLVFVKQGITKHAKSIKHEQIKASCEKIVKIFNPCGSFNVQLKIKDNIIYIFEINPRYSTTLVLSMESGINEIDLNIINYDIKDVEYVEEFKEISLIRRWENFFYEA